MGARLQSKPLLMVLERGLMTCASRAAAPIRFRPHVYSDQSRHCFRSRFAAEICQEKRMAKIAKTADRKKVMDTTKSTDCPKCGKPTRVVKRVKDREKDIPGGMYISCSACEFYEKL